MTAAAVTDDSGTMLLATIRLAKSGSERAFEELMIASEHRIARLAWRILGDPEEVKEALQETFLRLYRHLDQFDERLDFFPWLYRIAVNACRDLESKRRRRRLFFAPLETALAVATGVRRADDELALRDDLSLMTRAIDSLPRSERLAIILRDVEELSTEEVAAMMGNSPATVRVQVSKARAKVRAWMERRRAGWPR
jgi:RNA polymerase sigma-70 factor (ECF subfamily)